MSKRIDLIALAEGESILGLKVLKPLGFLFQMDEERFKQLEDDQKTDINSVIDLNSFFSIMGMLSETMDNIEAEGLEGISRSFRNHAIKTILPNVPEEIINIAIDLNSQVDEEDDDTEH